MQINNQKMLKELPAQTFYINVILILFANTVYFFCIATYPCHCQEPSIKARYHQKSSVVLLPERQLTKSHSTIEWCHQNSCRMTSTKGDIICIVLTKDSSTIHLSSGVSRTHLCDTGQRESSVLSLSWGNARHWVTALELYISFLCNTRKILSFLLGSFFSFKIR